VTNAHTQLQNLNKNSTTNNNKTKVKLHKVKTT